MILTIYEGNWETIFYHCFKSTQTVADHGLFLSLFISIFFSVIFISLFRTLFFLFAASYYSPIGSQGKRTRRSC